MKPILSIITVCFNSEKYIKRCIESVLQSTNNDVEYIIIDGASTDRTLDIINQYRRTQNIKLVTEKDNGIYDAMNKGIRNANGEYVYFLNSDDYLLPTALSQILDSINNNPKADCIYGNVIVTEEDERGIEQKVKIWYGDKNLDNLNYGMICSHQAFICKRSTIMKYDGFYTGLRIAADWDLVLRLYKGQCEFQYVDITMASFSRGGVSCSEEHEKERHIVRRRNKCYRYFDFEYYRALKTALHNKIYRK